MDAVAPGSDTWTEAGLLTYVGRAGRAGRRHDWPGSDFGSRSSACAATGRRWPSWPAAWGQPA